MYLRWNKLDATAPVAGTITLTPGADPSVFELEVAPDALPAADGDLTFSSADSDQDKDKVEVILAGCRIAEGSLRQDTRGRSCRFIARDFRWKWAQAQPINGEYNKRDAAGKILKPKKTARELGWLLYDRLPCPAVKEAQHVKALPDDEYPHVDWSGYVRPAEAFHDLCKQYNVLICPAVGPAEAAGDDRKVVGRIQLCKAGDGAAVPGAARHAWEQPFCVRDIPEKVLFVGGWTIEERPVELTAVAWDPAAEKYLPLAEVSYRPSGGWYFGAEKDISGAADAKACADTLWKAYQLPASMTIGKESFSRSEACLRWLDHAVAKGILAAGTAAASDVEEYLPAYVTGRHGTEEALNDPYMFHTSTSARVEASYTVDKRHGVIVFTRPVMDLTEGVAAGAELTMHCCWRVERYTREFTIPQGALGLWDMVEGEAVFHEWLVAADGGRSHPSDALATAADVAARRLVSAYARRWKKPPEPAVNTYPGVLNTMPDGCIEEVSWIFEGPQASRGPVTVVAWGVENDVVLPLRRAREKALELNKTVLAMRAHNRADQRVVVTATFPEEETGTSIHLEDL